ncbi:hypothetical protein IQ257_20290 [Coleofasciculus sp. LEGE 07092]|nr:hypothetical protein [Coleofasciculus sp. LEGE 07081]MBE9150787.1 hypothetical protein [Coleofasciculus sp. LEGE 07092]
MSTQVSLDELWKSAPSSEQVFQPDALTGLPDIAQRYLEHAIAPGTKLASAVRLRMHGEIKLKDWLPFRAEQVICWNRGMIWSATAWMNGLPIRGSDRLVDGEGAMQWKLLGLFPVMTATGSDITRSAVGRMQGECIWLPSVFCDRQVTWTVPDASHAHAHLTLLGETTELILTVNQEGRLESLKLKRWGNPEEAEHHYVDFGGVLERDSTFSGYTIPTRLRGGWYLGTDRFESEGEFFRATIEDAIYR